MPRPKKPGAPEPKRRSRKGCWPCKARKVKCGEEKPFSKILVPHDCHLNPFATVLPAMAIEDENILNLLLAYSASHRSRLLGHAEPYTRIARWTSGVFPSLRHALGDPRRRTSAATLATAIMLVSLKVISPSTFEVPIRWESHLMTAREIFLTRQKTDPDHFTGKVNTFLHRWLVYLDLFGSLSSRRAEAPLFNGIYWPLDTTAEYPKNDVDQGFEVDCFTGFTPRCCSLLARLSALTHQCDNVRVDPAGRLFTSWKPPASVLAKAEQLLQEMQDAGPERRSIPMTHHGKPIDPGMAAMDEAYRLSGMIHLHRRVLGRETSDPIVKDLVDALFDSLDQVSRGGQEEVCILFPLFTAGCESQNEDQRRQVSERVQGFESVGMKQIRGARKLMQKSWQVGLPWNVLANGEFLA
ncbi:Sterol regulatory element-binding protein ECM22 [Trichophyton interdigitale]|nr:Sterol regulatory element-binding protein ECM22 [Trichophyton interdigitale]KAG8210551.1 Sterol regulatory element-binding protein ECM22 [Trichophyton interdigitale]